MHNGIAAGVAVASLTIGAASGYYYAIKKLNAEYNIKMEEEIARTKEHYKRTYKADEYKTPQEAAEALGVEVSLDDAVEAVVEYAGIDTGTLFAEQAVLPSKDSEERNIFDDGDQLAIDYENRDTSKPYVVDISEFMDNPNEYEQIDLTYYAGDGILGDDKDEPIPDHNVDMVVGRDNLLMFGASDPEQPHVLLVRNEKMKTDFVITHSDGKFAHEVAGLMHADESFQRFNKRPRREE